VTTAWLSSARQARFQVLAYELGRKEHSKIIPICLDAEPTQNSRSHEQSRRSTTQFPAVSGESSYLVPSKRSEYGAHLRCDSAATLTEQRQCPGQAHAIILDGGLLINVADQML